MSLSTELSSRGPLLNIYYVPNFFKQAI